MSRPIELIMSSLDKVINEHMRELEEVTGLSVVSVNVSMMDVSGINDTKPRYKAITTVGYESSRYFHKFNRRG